MNVTSWLGYAENILANSSQKLLSVHEILDSMTKTMNQPNLLFPEGAAAYATLAAALFSEIQNPQSKFLRSGNKFALKLPEDTPARSVLSDRALAPRRLRRTSSRDSEGISPVPRPQELPTPVKLSTTTNPPGRYRASPFDPTITDNGHRRINGVEKSSQRDSLTNLPSTTSLPSRRKRVLFALDRNEIHFLPTDLLPFPTAATATASL